ncbi:MAG: hypothetical protein KGM16_18220 [Bacteroidota bacterium]|jgi:hypothetical protein|nr:hypothetical protein [Bacteroidota bacterium]
MAQTKNKTRKNSITRIKRTKSPKEKGVDTLKYCGRITLKEDPLVIQKKLRDEWQ